MRNLRKLGEVHPSDVRRHPEGLKAHLTTVHPCPGAGKLRLGDGQAHPCVRMTDMDAGEAHRKTGEAHTADVLAVLVSCNMFETDVHALRSGLRGSPTDGWTHAIVHVRTTTVG